MRVKFMRFLASIVAPSGSARVLHACDGRPEVAESLPVVGRPGGCGPAGTFRPSPPRRDSGRAGPPGEHETGARPIIQLASVVSTSAVEA